MSKFVLVNIKTKGPIKTELNYMGGSTIRGVYVNNYINKHKIKEDISLNKEYRDKLLTKNIRFFDAYPLVDGNYSIPTPLCFYASKDDIKKFSRDKGAIPILNEFKDEDKEKIEEGFQRVNKSEFSIIKDKQLSLISIDRIENLHNCRQISEENLFRYEAIDKNQAFYTVIQCAEEIVDEVKAIFDNQVMYIGGSKSSGYGRCETEVEAVLDYPELKQKYGIGYDFESKTLNIFFQSDAIIRDTNGNLSSTIPEQILKDKLGLKEVKYNGSSVISRDVKGYNAMWKSKLPSVTAVKAGSVITYTYKGILDKEKIEALEIEGIGARKSEGFGRIFINPKFDIDKCSNYTKEEIKRKIAPMDAKSEQSMTFMLNNIVKLREDEYLTDIIVDALYKNNDESGGKIIKLAKFPNSQKGKLINVITEALNEKDEAKSKQIIKTFIGEVKTKTKNMYDNKSECMLFKLSIKDYLNEVISDKLLKDITNTKLELKYPELKGIKCSRTSDYRMKLKLTKKIMQYKLREEDKSKGGKK